jgi:hypothetical protein
MHALQNSLPNNSVKQVRRPSKLVGRKLSTKWKPKLKPTRRKPKSAKHDKISGWDKVIADAERHISRLKAAIGHAKEMKESGEPWPGAQFEGRRLGRQHII